MVASLSFPASLFSQHKDDGQDVLDQSEEQTTSSILLSHPSINHIAGRQLIGSISRLRLHHETD